MAEPLTRPAGANLVAMGDDPANRYGWMADTTPKAFEKLMEACRELPLGRKLQLALEWSDALERAARERVRRQYPEASEREVVLRAAAPRLGRELMIKVYGWDPESGSPP